MVGIVKSAESLFTLRNRYASCRDISIAACHAFGIGSPESAEVYQNPVCAAVVLYFLFKTVFELLERSWRTPAGALPCRKTPAAGTAPARARRALHHFIQVALPRRFTIGGDPHRLIRPRGNRTLLCFWRRMACCGRPAACFRKEQTNTHRLNSAAESYRCAILRLALLGHLKNRRHAMSLSPDRFPFDISPLLHFITCLADPRPASSKNEHPNRVHAQSLISRVFLTGANESCRRLAECRIVFACKMLGASKRRLRIGPCPKVAECRITHVIS